MSKINKIYISLIILCILCSSYFVSAIKSTIILDSSNNYTDIIEPNVTIYIITSSPILGTNIEFACGDCSRANFADSVTAIGGGKKICGYGSQIGVKIINNDDKLCVKSKLSGNKYTIDLLTWVPHNTCYDNNNGSSCSLAGNRFAYIRSDEYENNINRNINVLYKLDSTTSMLISGIIVVLIAIVILLIIFRKRKKHRY